MIEVDDVIEILKLLADDANLKVAVTESAKGGLLTGAAVLVGGLVAGPAGLAVGGALGGATSAYLSWGKFKSISTVLSNMTKEQKAELYQRSLSIIGNLSVSDVPSLQRVVTGDSAMTAKLVKDMVDYVESNMDMKIID